MKEAYWQPAGGLIPADKALFRGMALHELSELTSDMEAGEIAYIGGVFYAMNGSGPFVIADASDLTALKGRVDVETDSVGRGTHRTLVAQVSAPSTGASEGVFYTKTVGAYVEAFFRYAGDGSEIQLTSQGSLNVGSSGGAKMMDEQAVAPTTSINQGAFYTKDVGGVTEAFYRYDNSGAELQLTVGGKLNVASAAAPVPLDSIDPDPDYPAENVLLGTAGYRFWAVQCADGQDSGFIAQATLPDSTKDYQLVLEMAMDTALSGRSVAVRVEMKATQAGENPFDASNDVATTQAISCRSDTAMQVVTNASFVIPSTYLHADNQQVRLRVLRDGDGTGATDDHTGKLNIYNAFFKAVL